MTCGKPIAVRSQFISDVSAVKPLVAFYDIQGKKGEVLLFCSVSDTTQDTDNKKVFNQWINMVFCIFQVVEAVATELITKDKDTKLGHRNDYSDRRLYKDTGTRK
jgi:hypothetical protein